MPALIHQAIVDGRVHQLRLLARIGANLNAREERYGRTPIITASLLINEDLAVAICQILLKHKCDCNTKDSSGRTALAHVASLGREKVALYLLDDINIDLSVTDSDGNTPLILACQSGNAVIVASMVKKMIQSSMDVNTRNKDGFTAILMAAKHGHRYCERILRHQGQALVDIRDNIKFYNVDDWLRWYDEQNHACQGGNKRSINSKDSNGKKNTELVRQSSFRRSTTGRNSSSKQNSRVKSGNELLPKIDTSYKPLSGRSRSSSKGKEYIDGKPGLASGVETKSTVNDVINQQNRSYTPSEVHSVRNPIGNEEFYPSPSRRKHKRKAIDLNTLLSIYSSNNSFYR
ncbi:uncharacterized protein TRIADDRAFT_58161 [Trichoplax adhaerens]|uniref:Uncharacterized protein n=1 Tax=Trichoplax adhaerens TaxID=10228 RepID=B3S116_TRIAD|nr:hypothetical protein TRIADDRAFT_58161 [Trichoplax adhaerens]EDV23489.1 hypothetical protein TRIADDRAFT_58161 [Trichoplax adhaerens]|eukprot:XP_002114399.1 hypothetical protein TRIADDRAFT_58161 [Trichoplax adhaerens]